MRKKVTVGQIVLLIVISILALCCLLPLLLVLIASFSSDYSLRTKGFSFIPLEWSTDGWRYVLSMGSQLVLSYRNTIFITVVGTLSSLLIMSMYAYALSRRNFTFRKLFSFILLGTMLFDGGQLSRYLINVSVYHLKDSMFLLYKPVVSAMNVIIIRTYLQGNVAESLVESAQIDGAGEFRIYGQIIMPLAKPALASVGFMTAIGYWNNWETGYLYIKTQSKLPLQTLLMQIEKKIEMLNNPGISGAAAQQIWETVPELSARMAMLIAVLGPIMIAYPFFQKYFIQGLTVGSVKG